jgi:hypothetical protein
LSSIDPAIVLSIFIVSFIDNDNINMDSTIAGSMNDNIIMDSTIAGSLNDNIHMNSTIAGSMNGNINMESTCSVHIYNVIH